VSRIIVAGTTAGPASGSQLDPEVPNDHHDSACCPHASCTGVHQHRAAGASRILAGYSGLTRQAYELDLRQYVSWCHQHHLRLFQARRADIECFARDLETRGRARATITRPPRTPIHGPPMRYNRARGSLDRHATYIVAAYLAGAAGREIGCPESDSAWPNHSGQAEPRQPRLQATWVRNRP
jgi:hypothetical protein